MIEYLESRRLLSSTLSIVGVQGITVFDGVGFEENQIATATYLVNGKAGNPNNLKVQVNFGDGSGWNPYAYMIPYGAIGQLIIKASYVYSAGVAKTFNVETKITGPGVSFDLKKSLVVNDILLTAPAARGGAPLAEPVTIDAANVHLGITGVQTFSSYAGVGFNRNEEAVVTAAVNGVADTKLGDVHAQLNFGDAPQWFQADVAYYGSFKTQFIVKNRQHVYTKAGTYPVTLVLSGPDGTTLSEQVCSVIVNNLPMPASNPPKVPPNASIGSALDEDLAINGVQAIGAKANSALKNIQIGVLTSTIAGAADTQASQYQVYVNWGDSPAWIPGDVTVGIGTSMNLLGSHTYAKAGTYRVVADVIGTDGTSLARECVMIIVN